jgi:hypothetical protein
MAIRVPEDGIPRPDGLDSGHSLGLVLSNGAGLRSLFINERY